MIRKRLGLSVITRLSSVGMFSVVNTSDGGCSKEPVYHCNQFTIVTGFNSKFLTREGRHKHIKRIHRNERVYCGHGFGRSYSNKSKSLKHHDRTCDDNPNAARVGAGVNQQHYHSTGREDHRMKQVRPVYDGNLRIYRKSLNSEKIYV